MNDEAPAFAAELRRGRRMTNDERMTKISEKASAASDHSPFTIHHSQQFLLAGCICICLLALGGCKRPGSASHAQPTASPVIKKVAAGPKLDPCTLLTREEIAAVQGSAVTDTKSSEGGGGAFRMSQCYFAAAESSKSVSLAITQSNPESGNSPRDYWKETFGRFSGDANEEREEAEKKKNEPARPGEKREEEEHRPPKKIEGVGEEAFWSGNRFGGALYVLHKEWIIRVSVGGPDNEEGKINKSKTLAEKVINRL